jgi:hypothetical protein
VLRAAIPPVDIAGVGAGGDAELWKRVITLRVSDAGLAWREAVSRLVQPGIDRARGARTRVRIGAHPGARCRRLLGLDNAIVRRRVLKPVSVMAITAISMGRQSPSGAYAASAAEAWRTSTSRGYASRRAEPEAPPGRDRLGPASCPMREPRDASERATRAFTHLRLTLYPSGTEAEPIGQARAGSHQQRLPRPFSTPWPIIGTTAPLFRLTA